MDLPNGKDQAVITSIKKAPQNNAPRSDNKSNSGSLRRSIIKNSSTIIKILKEITTRVLFPERATSVWDHPSLITITLKVFALRPTWLISMARKQGLRLFQWPKSLHRFLINRWLNARVCLAINLKTSFPWDKISITLTSMGNRTKMNRMDSTNQTFMALTMMKASIIWLAQGVAQILILLMSSTRELSFCLKVFPSHHKYYCSARKGASTSVKARLPIFIQSHSTRIWWTMQTT